MGVFKKLSKAHEPLIFEGNFSPQLLTKTPQAH